MHKSYKKTVAILVTCALIGALLCMPVSASSQDFLDNFNFDSFYLNNELANHIVQSNGSTVGITGLYPGLNAGYFNLSFRFNLSASAATASTPLKFNFWFNCDGTQCNFLNVTDTTQGLFGFNSSSSKLVRIGYCSIQDSKILVEVNGSLNSNDYDYFVLNIYSYLNPADFYFFSFTNFNYEYGNLIVDNANENTDKIIQAEKDLYEQEKNEIQSSGNQATDAADSIPNESEGFINALGTFVSTMSTTDTACSITFPAIKVPSIAGLPEATISSEREVDFQEAIGLIPSDIMDLIQAITTISLIVYCFKELYDTISEALTRKKAN